MDISEQESDYIAKKKNIALKYVGINKEKLFDELIDSGIHEEEIENIIDNWKEAWGKDILKKEGMLVLQGVAACLHEFELLLESETSNVGGDNYEFNESLANLGIMLTLLGDVAIQKEGKNTRKEVVETTQEMLSQIRNAEQREKKNASKRANDSKYAPGRDLYRKAQKIARHLWEAGDTRKHHQMKIYLVNEYKDEDGSRPFRKFDPSCGFTEKGLLKKLREVVGEMNRADLITGENKPK